MLRTLLYKSKARILRKPRLSETVVLKKNCSTSDQVCEIGSCTNCKIHRAILLTQCGRICRAAQINLSTVFAGQYVGIREIADRIWLVSLMDYDLGVFDHDDNRVEPMPPVWTDHNARAQQDSKL